MGIYIYLIAYICTFIHHIFIIIFCWYLLIPNERRSSFPPFYNNNNNNSHHNHNARGCYFVVLFGSDPLFKWDNFTEKNMIQEMRVTLRSTTIISPCKLGSLEDYFPLGRNLWRAMLPLKAWCWEDMTKHTAVSHPNPPIFSTAQPAVLFWNLGWKYQQGNTLHFFVDLVTFCRTKKREAPTQNSEGVTFFEAKAQVS